MSQRKPLADRLLDEIRNEKPTLTLPFRKSGRIPFWRLDDDEYLVLRRRSLAIEDDYNLLMRLNFDRTEDKCLSLGEALSALTELAGPSSNSFDDFKQSFSFPFLHGLPADRPPANYLLTVQDVRGSLYFSSCRVVEKGDLRIKQHLLHKPFSEELNREELNILAATMYGYLQGFSEYVTPLPFVEKIDSQLIVYGYAVGNYFKEQHDREDAYKAAVEQWRRIVASHDDKQATDSPTDTSTGLTP